MERAFTEIICEDNEVLNESEQEENLGKESLSKSVKMSTQKEIEESLEKPVHKIEEKFSLENPPETSLQKETEKESSTRIHVSECTFSSKSTKKCSSEKIKKTMKRKHRCISSDELPTTSSLWKLEYSGSDMKYILKRELQTKDSKNSTSDDFQKPSREYSEKNPKEPEAINKTSDNDLKVENNLKLKVTETDDFVTPSTTKIQVAEPRSMYMKSMRTKMDRSKIKKHKKSKGFKKQKSAQMVFKSFEVPSASQAEKTFIEKESDGRDISGDVQISSVSKGDVWNQPDEKNKYKNQESSYTSDEYDIPATSKVMKRESLKVKIDLSLVTPSMSRVLTIPESSESTQAEIKCDFMDQTEKEMRGILKKKATHVSSDDLVTPATSKFVRFQDPLYTEVIVDRYIPKPPPRNRYYKKYKNKKVSPGKCQIPLHLLQREQIINLKNRKVTTDVSSKDLVIPSTSKDVRFGEPKSTLAEMAFEKSSSKNSDITPTFRGIDKQEVSIPSTSKDGRYGVDEVIAIPSTSKDVRFGEPEVISIPSTSKDVRFGEPEVISIPSTSKDVRFGKPESTPANITFEKPSFINLDAAPTFRRNDEHKVMSKGKENVGEDLIESRDFLAEFLGEKPNRDLSDKQFGFLGLGAMGQHMVKHLISYGHYVTVWDHKKNLTGTLDKCNEFVKMGAKKAESPADVVKMCDITFCCVSDANAAHEIVFGAKGVLEGLTKSYPKYKKGFVGMSFLHPDQSTKIYKAMRRKTCRYLEVAVVGTGNEARDRNLVFLVAGKDTLMDDCMSCFAVMAKDAFYLGPEIGRAMTLKAVLSMVLGPTMAAFTEAISLMIRRGVDVDMFLQFLGVSTLACEALIKRGLNVVKGNYEAATEGFKPLVEDLAMARALANENEIPMQVASATSEFFKYKEYFLKPESNIYQSTCEKNLYINNENIDTSERDFNIRHYTLFVARKLLQRSKNILNQIQRLNEL